jgi:hypothetical protein
MTLQLSFDEQFAKLREELKTKVEIGRNWRIFSDTLVPAILDLEEGLYHRRGPYGDYNPVVLETYFRTHVAPNWNANEKYLIPYPEANQDAIVGRPAIGFICGMTLKEVKEELKISVNLTLRKPSGAIEDVMEIYKNFSFQSLGYSLTIVPREPAVRRTGNLLVGIKMNDIELQRRLDLPRNPTEPVFDDYRLERARI